MRHTHVSATRALPLSLSICLGLGLVACGDENGGPHSNTVDCDLETRDETYVEGMAKTGTAGLTFTIVTATPAPPARNDNTWTIEISQGNAPAEASAVKATPFMPDHGHGTPTVTGVTQGAEPGQYTLTPVNLFMPGLWEIKLEATVNAVSDNVVFRFCIPG